MINHSIAYASFRKELDALHDFVILVSYAVPTLNDAIVSQPSLVRRPPDHFKHDKRSDPELVTIIGSYPEELAKVLTVSAFSFFEAYFRAVMEEVVAFHGGEGAILARSKRRATRTFTSIPVDALRAKRKLQEFPKPKNADKYRANTRKLSAIGFNFPSDLFSAYGARILVEKVKDKKRGIRAFEIPGLLRDALLFPLTAADESGYERVRELRNKIGHGAKASVKLSAALRDASMLRELAVRVDKHVVEHLMVIEEFA